MFAAFERLFESSSEFVWGARTAPPSAALGTGNFTTRPVQVCFAGKSALIFSATPTLKGVVSSISVVTLKGGLKSLALR